MACLSDPQSQDTLRGQTQGWVQTMGFADDGDILLRGKEEYVTVTDGVNSSQR